jgi:RHS repeat-associated protein
MTPNQVPDHGYHAYTYDADGNVLAVDGGQTAAYVYDALNRRVRAQTASATYEFMDDYAGRRTSSWYNPSSGNPGAGNEGRIYWDGTQIAYRAYNGQTYFDHRDWLGTERMRTGYTGAVAATFTSLPFGDGAASTLPGGDPAIQDNASFATLDQDPESNTHHAQFRNYSPTQGRWLTPDPYSGSYDITNPQSMNRYAYVLNNPLSFTDPSGLLDCKYPPCEVVTDQYGNTYTVDSQGNVTGGPTQSVGVNGGPPITGGNVWVSGNPDGGAAYGGLDFGGGFSGPGIRLNCGLANCQPLPDSPEKDCLGQALAKNVVSFATDAIGAIPLEGQAAAAIQLAAAGAGLGNGLATGDAIGFVGSIVGGQTTVIGTTATTEISVTLAKTVPAVGNLLSGILAVRDIIHGVQDYQNCLSVP